jgi:hypothetical protein
MLVNTETLIIAYSHHLDRGPLLRLLHEIRSLPEVKR